MAAEYGRKVAFTWDGSAINGIRENGLTMAGEAVNITSSEDGGVQQLLDEDAETSHEIKISGVTKDTTLRQAKANGNIQAAVTLTYTDGYVISGTFNLSEYTEKQPYNDAVTFEATLMSTGTVTHTP